MARPSTLNDVVEKKTRAALIETKEFMTNPVLLKTYQAMLEAVTKSGGEAVESYSTIELLVPKSRTQLEQDLRNAQFSWDEYQKQYNIVLNRDPNNEDSESAYLSISEYRHEGIKRWAREEGLADPWLAYDTDELAQVRKEMGMDE